MCDDESNGSQTESEQTYTQLSLLDLPVEIFVHICSFLDASTLVHGLGLVCKQFNEILNDDLLWKMRISQIWPDVGYPILPPAEDDELFWKLSCVAIEKQISLWQNEDSMEKLSLNDLHYSTIDGLLLMHDGNICISGARDRSLVCWKLPTTENEKEEPVRVHAAHNGWIWDLAALDNNVYSCSWDQSVKGWKLINTGLFNFQTYDMYMTTMLVIFTALIKGKLSEKDINISRIFVGALLCIASCPELAIFATGSYSKSVLVFDSRTESTPVATYKPHQGTVIRLAMNSQFILSASEDKTVAVWDQRAGKVLKNISISKESFPLSMCMRRDAVFVGDSIGKLHVLDPRRDFEPVKFYTTQHKNGITGVHVSPGCLITSSKDQTVRISSPTDPPQNLITLSSSYGEIASLDYLNDVLAFSGADGIDIWRPRTRSR